MRIVMIEDFFHPEAGYQCNILSRYLVDYGHEVIIVTSEMEKQAEKYKSFFGCDELEIKDEAFTNHYQVRIIRMPLIAHISGRSIYNSRIFKVIDSLNPDILYVHGNDTYIGIRYILRQHRLKYPIISDSHMIEIASANRFSGLFKKFYRSFVTPHIVRNSMKVIRTVDIDFVSKYYGIPISQAPFIGFGSDTKLFHVDKSVRDQFRKEHDIARDAFVCVYAGKLDEKKGGKFFAEAIREKIPSKTEVVFIVVGNTVGDYGKETEEIFSESENRVLRFPTQKYVDLPKFFQAADITVYPKQCSLSFYDSTACGAPALVEANEIGIQRGKETGCYTFNAGDLEDFRAKIVDYTNLSKVEYERIRDSGIEYILNNYNYENQAKKYEEIIVNTIANYKAK